MRLYLLRHPGGFLVVGAFAIADVLYRALLREPFRNLLLKGRHR